MTILFPKIIDHKKRSALCASLFFFSTFFPFCINAQNSVSFEAYSDAKEVLVNAQFDVSFTLKNANGTNFVPPGFKNFIVLAGPSSSTSMQIINGQVSREMGYSYTLQPKKTGQFTIGSASIKANGKTLKTKPLTIKVVKGKASAGGGAARGAEAYVNIEPSKTEAYPGEQILLDFKLYTTVSLDRYDIMEEPDYRGFFAKELRRYNSRTQREVINGQQVTTKVLRRLALFPQQTGELTIPPARIQLAVIEDNDRRGFFFRRNVRPLYVATDPVAVKVKELPAGTPESFTGAVGKFDFQASVNRMELSTDDAISVTMLIGGNGDLKRIQPPPLMVSDSFEIYPPKVLEENSKEQQGELYGRKVIEYLLLPKYPGSYTIAPEFSYFDTEAGSYKTISAGPYYLKVRQGTDRHHAMPKPLADEVADDDIRFIKMETSLEKKGAYFVGSPVFWTLTSLPVLAFLGLFFFKKAKEKNENLDIGFLKRKHANKVAQKHLATAQGHLQAGASRAFYDEISKASLGYISDKLDIPLSELSKDNVKEKLASLRVGQPLVDGFMKIMQTCEMALFAGMDNAADMQGTYEKAMSVISGIEEEIGEIDAG